jgi:hypothetical protein
MGSYATFEKYFQETYYNEIFAAVKNYVVDNRSSMGVYSYTLLSTSYVKLIDIHVEGVSFKSSSGNLLEFNVTVEADLVLKGFGKKDYDVDSQAPWFTLSCTGYLSDGLHMVTIREVNESHRNRFDKETSLSKYLIPYLYAEDIEKEAEKFLEKYCEKALHEPMPLPIDEILGDMGLVLYEAPLPENVFGQTYFSEASAKVYEDGKVVQKNIEPGTILINPDIFFLRNVGSWNNTVIHECVHWDRHDKFFEMQKLLNDNLSSITCKVVDDQPQKSNGLENALQWAEWQANVLAPRILMPASTTKQKLNEILKRLRYQLVEELDSEIMNLAIKELADFFQVSLLAAKIRAVELGFTQAQGVHNYLNGQYLPSFSFRNSALQKDETFIIDIRSACLERIINEELKQALSQGDFIFVNNMFCINDEKYIVVNEEGQCALTTYASQHVDECCLKFKRKIIKSSLLGNDFYTECILCRDIDASAFCEHKYIDEKDNQDVVERAAEIKKLRDEGERVMAILRELPNSFAGTLNAHMKRLKKADGSKMTNLELSMRTGLSDRYIQDLRKEELNVSFSTVCAICIGLHLHPIFSEDLIRKSRNDYPMNEEGFFCRMLINHHYMDSLLLCNQRLLEAGYQAWGNPDPNKLLC